MSAQLPDLSLSDFLRLALQTIRRPREVCAYLTGLRLPRDVLWLVLATVTVVSVLVGQVTALLLVPGADTIDGLFLANPLMMAAIQAVVMIITVFAILWIGGAMGGKAGLNDILVVLAWLQAVMILVQLVQTVALLVAPILAEIVTLIGLGLFLWLFTTSIAAIHKFENLALVFVMIVVSTLGISFALTLVLAILGVSLEVSGGV